MNENGADKIKKINLRLPRHVLDGVQSVADYENRSVNSQILYWILEGLKDYDDDPPGGSTPPETS